MNRRVSFGLAAVLGVAGLGVHVAQGFSNPAREDGTATAAMSSAVEKLRYDSCASTCETIAQAAREFRADTLARPSTIEDLLEDPGVSGWNGPYLSLANSHTDPWGGRFVVEDDPAGSLRIVAPGPDSRIGTPDDVIAEVRSR